MLPYLIVMLGVFNVMVLAATEREGKRSSKDRTLAVFLIVMQNATMALMTLELSRYADIVKTWFNH